MAHNGQSLALSKIFSPSILKLSKRTEMTDKQYTSDQVERLVNTGLMNLWYPVLPSWRVHSDPVGITRLSQKIVLWRDNTGVVHAIEDRCPHRGARLSLGWNLGDRLACWYHGIEMDGDGIVVNVPAMNNASMVGKQCVAKYPARKSRALFFCTSAMKLIRSRVTLICQKN